MERVKTYLMTIAKVLFLVLFSIVGLYLFAIGCMDIVSGFCMEEIPAEGTYYMMRGIIRLALAVGTFYFTGSHYSDWF